MVKKLLVIGLVGIVAFSSWYMFLKEGEFDVHFKVKTLPGDVEQTFLIWNRSLQDTEIVKTNESIKQTLVVNQETYELSWQFDLIDDSSTRVNITFSQPDKRIQNKLAVPFTASKIEEDAAVIGRKFYHVLQQHLEITKVKVDGIDTLATKECLCFSVETSQLDKAYEMQVIFGDLTSYILENELVGTGMPLLDITEWDETLGSLKYDFCFPVEPKDSLKTDKDFFMKTIDGATAIKATYNGNYITSDRAWYYIKQYAVQENLELLNYPKEIFYSNPNMGSNEREWRTEIFWPIK